MHNTFKYTYIHTYVLTYNFTRLPHNDNGMFTLLAALTPYATDKVSAALLVALLVPYLKKQPRNFSEKNKASVLRTLANLFQRFGGSVPVHNPAHLISHSHTFSLTIALSHSHTFILIRTLAVTHTHTQSDTHTLTHTIWQGV